MTLLLAPATKLREGNVFTSVCESFCSQGAVSVQGGLCPGGFLSGGGACQGDTSSVWLHVGSTHPTVMHSCLF